MPSGDGGGTDAQAQAVVELAEAFLQLRLRVRGALLLALERLHARRTLAAVQVGLLLASLQLDLQVTRAGEPAALVVGLRARATRLLLGDALPRTLGVGVETILDVDLEVLSAPLGLGPDAGARVVTRPLHALSGLALGWRN